MNIKNFIVGGLVGGIVDFLLGWIFYGMLFSAQFPEGENMNLVFVFFGCMVLGFFMSYIFTKWASISTPKTGLEAGALIGFFVGLWSNFFMLSSAAEPNYSLALLDIGIMVVGVAIVGASIGFVLDKMK